MSANFTIGQRWISQNEPQLGLGVIVEVSGRLVTISFPAAAERRNYATDQSPLTRVEYQIGDEIITSDEGRYKVVETYENRGLIIYNCTDELGQQHIVPEIEISSFVTFTSPSQRLLNCQIDSDIIFKLRVSTIQFIDHLQRSSANGLIGSRTSLLPHQLYIAHEVSKRFAPRTLLADEVGLGKTIEAGMIAHQQLHAGFISRILIVVPESLVHQWLVEMIRRFNLHFSVFDQERMQTDQSHMETDSGITLYDEASNSSKEKQSDDSLPNPFESEQLIICSIDLLTSNSQCLNNIKLAGFDMLIVDEAHHLGWSLETSSPEYECISMLSVVCPGVLLLTATPESIGLENYYAQLSLLDPSRFQNFAQFKKEQISFKQLGELVDSLLQVTQQLSNSTDKIELDSKLLSELQLLLPTDAISQNRPNKIQVFKWIDYLVDIHGTSRVLFRNTRSAIGGFQDRVVNHYALETVQQYNSFEGKQMICPETNIKDKAWLDFDPRVKWLIEFLKEVRPAKVLLICTHFQTAIALEHYLQLSKGINSAAFHEQLSILERDRAAAYFADEIQGAQILICSEIGSEGRNFQFANNLILFDLPLNPDLLEQRIGRLDRIGQSKTIHIHVPYIKGTAQELLFIWYQQGLNQFTQTFSSAKKVFDENSAELFKSFDDWSTNNHKVQKFIKKVYERSQIIKQESEQGKDKLLEYNSCRMDVSQSIINEIIKFEEEVSFDMYMEQVFDAFNIDYIEHSENIKIIEPIESIQNDVFLKLKNDRMTITTDRATALVREDVEFFSFEHPMIEDVMDFIITGDFGNATMATVSLNNINPGSIFLETVFACECLSPKHMQLQRFLPLSPIRFFHDEKHRDIGHVLTHEKLNQHCKSLAANIIKPIVPHIRSKVEKMLEQMEKLAHKKIDELKENAINEHQQYLNFELERLRSLQKINSSVRTEEIIFLEEQIDSGKAYLQRANYKLQAIRVILTV